MGNVWEWTADWWSVTHPPGRLTNPVSLCVCVCVWDYPLSVFICLSVCECVCNFSLSLSLPYCSNQINHFFFTVHEFLQYIFIYLFKVLYIFSGWSIIRQWQSKEGRFIYVYQRVLLQVCMYVCVYLSVYLHMCVCVSTCISLSLCEWFFRISVLIDSFCNFDKFVCLSNELYGSLFIVYHSLYVFKRN